MYIEKNHNQISIIIILESCTKQSSCNNPLANPTKEQDEFGGPQSPAKRLNIGNSEAFCKIVNLVL